MRRRKRTSQKTERPRLTRLRRLWRQSRSQRRRRLRPSSIPPIHPFFFFFFPSVRLTLFSSSLHPSSSFPYFPARKTPFLHKPSPEEYFYQQFCKYWFRFLAQKRD